MQSAASQLLALSPSYGQLPPQAQQQDIKQAAFERTEALKRFRLLPLGCALTKLGATEIEGVLVPAARRRIAAAR